MEAAQADVAEAYASLRGVGQALRGLDTIPLALGVILEKVEVKERIVADTTYQLLGVRWWGEGAFIRERKLGKEIKATTLWRASAGWIVYNRLFAFRGSFAMLTSEHEGCHASNEFPMFRAKEGLENADLLCRYIVHCLNSPQYLAIVDAESTGSTKTSRNRFNEDEFLTFMVQLPQTTNDLQTAVALLDGLSDLRRRQQRMLDLTKSFREEMFGLLPEPAEN